ncbi:polysaccharide biosynthesis tyrosine autokinase [Blastococcus sp. SYSU DS0828]
MAGPQGAGHATPSFGGVRRYAPRLWRHTRCSRRGGSRRVDVRKALTALRASWWLIVAGMVLGGAGALVGAQLQQPMYEANTQFFVATQNTNTTSDVFQGGQFSQERVTSYARLITGEQLAGRVVDRLGLDESATALASRISAEPIADTVLIDVSVEDRSPSVAREIAQAIGLEFTRLVEELETAPGAATSPVAVRVTLAPEEPDSPSSPQVARSVLVGSVLGGVVGVGLAFLRVALDRSVKRPDEISESLGLPVIGTIARDNKLAKAHVIDREAVTRAAEDYRQLRTNLQYLKVDDPPKVIMLTSALPDEGKTTTVVNLAVALADAGRRVTVVDGDLRKPKVTRYLGLIGGVGLTNILSGSAGVDDVLQRHGTRGLNVIAAGPTPPNPGEMLSSSQMRAMLDGLRSENDFILVDAPPLLPVADAVGLAVHVDGVLLSARYGRTQKEQLRQAAAALERVGAKALGVILNIVPGNSEIATAYGYGHKYEVGDEGPGPKFR